MEIGKQTRKYASNQGNTQKQTMKLANKQGNKQKKETHVELAELPLSKEISKQTRTQSNKHRN